MSTVASYVGQREQGDQKVQAFMTLVSSEGKGSVQESSSKQGQKRTYSAEEQQKYIRKLQEQNRELRAQVKASRGDSTDSNLPHPPGGRGRGCGRGRGGGRGRGAGGGVVNAAVSPDNSDATSHDPAQAATVESSEPAAAEATPASSEVLQFQAFCAEATGVESSSESSSGTPSDDEKDPTPVSSISVPGSSFPRVDGPGEESDKFSKASRATTSFPTTKHI